MVPTTGPAAAAAQFQSSAEAPELAPEALEFPPGFLWGAATSAYQVEGGITANNWAPWERSHGSDGRPRVAVDQRCGPAVGHWLRFADDLELMRWLGLSCYRFSVEWSRIEPLPGYFDPEPLGRYRRWCELLRAAGIAPLVTLHHFTEPVWLAEQGGFARRGAVDAFVRFVEHVAAGLGDLVHLWTTINEPVGYAVQGWWRGVWPPGRTEPAVAVEVVENLLLAHAGAYRALHDAAGRQECRVGLAHNIVTFRPQRRHHPADRVAARLLDAAYNRAVLDACGSGELRLRLPGLRYAAIHPQLAGTQDYLGVTHHHPIAARFAPTRPHRLHVDCSPDGESNDLDWTHDPESLAESLQRLAGYRLPILVLQHGTCDGDAPGLRRRRFLAHSLAGLRAAMACGLDVRGYMHWSLLDTYEWGHGFSVRCGLFRVNHTTGARSPTSSAEFYRRLIAAQPAAGRAGREAQ